VARRLGQQDTGKQPAAGELLGGCYLCLPFFLLLGERSQGLYLLTTGMC
jgi:hypothetical protein